MEGSCGEPGEEFEIRVVSVRIIVQVVRRLIEIHLDAESREGAKLAMADNIEERNRMLSNSARLSV